MLSQRQTKILNQKRAVSALIAEVMMISMALVMAGAVYSFLKFYVQKPLPTESCPEGVSLIISDYKCQNGLLNITFKNQGRYDIDKVIVKINNESGDTAPIPLFETIMNDTFYGEAVFIYTPFENSLIPGQEQIKLFNYSAFNTIKLIETEPTKGVDKYGREVLCENAISRIPVEC